MFWEIKDKSKELSAFMKVISHEKRLLMLCLLLDWEKSMTELQEMLEMNQSLMSQFSTKMKDLGYIQSEKRGKEVFYSLCDPKVEEFMKALKKIY